MNVAIAIAVLWPVGIFVLAVAWRQQRQSVSVSKRLGAVSQELSLRAQPAAVESQVGKKPSKTRTSVREQWARGPQAAALRLRMSEYYLFRIASFVIPFLLGLAVRGIVGGVILGGLGIVGMTMYFRTKQRRWLIKAEESLPEFLRCVANALRAGSSLSQSLALVAKDTVGPLGVEVRRVLRRESLGFSLVDALQELQRRIPSKDLALAVMAITIQRDVGGSLADLLDNIVRTIVERQRLKAEVRIITSQGRYSGMVLTGLPFILGVILWFTGPSYFHPMFHSELGWALIGAACVSVAIGGFLINRMVRAPEM
jgi:tight adherence protein B